MRRPSASMAASSSMSSSYPSALFSLCCTVPPSCGATTGRYDESLQQLRRGWVWGVAACSGSLPAHLTPRLLHHHQALLSRAVLGLLLAVTLSTVFAACVAWSPAIDFVPAWLWSTLVLWPLAMICVFRIVGWVLLRKAGITASSLAAQVRFVEESVRPMCGAILHRDDAAIVKQEVEWAADMAKYMARFARLRIRNSLEDVMCLPHCQRRPLARQLRQLIARYRGMWSNRSRPGGLEDSAEWIDYTRRALESRALCCLWCVCCPKTCCGYGGAKHSEHQQPQAKQANSLVAPLMYEPRASAGVASAVAAAAQKPRSRSSSKD